MFLNCLSLYLFSLTRGVSYCGGNAGPSPALDLTQTCEDCTKQKKALWDHMRISYGCFFPSLIIIHWTVKNKRLNPCSDFLTLPLFN